MSKELSALEARWEAFLLKTRDRVEEILAEAEPGCLALLEQGGFDPFTMGNALPAIQRRLQDLSALVEDTWSQQVDPAMSRAGADRARLAAGCAQARDLRTWVDARHEAFEIRLQATVSRILWARLSPGLPRRLNCTQCGSPLPLPRGFRVVSLPCPACRSINTFDPGPAAILDAYAIRHLAREEVWEGLRDEEPFPKPEPLRATETYQAEITAWRRRYGLEPYPIRAPY